jgi:hypothetical protein
MPCSLIIGIVLAVLFLIALALAREIRLRHALQRLVRALLARFHPQEIARESKPKPTSQPANIDDASTDRL